MKFGCTCGHGIVDQTDFLPYKARILADEDTEKPVNQLADALAQYWEAREQGRETEFIRAFWRSHGFTERGAEYYAKRLADKPLATVLSELMSPFWSNYDRAIYECEECGRLWVQADRNQYVSYQPETDTRHILRAWNHDDPYAPIDE